MDIFSIFIAGVFLFGVMVGVVIGAILFALFLASKFRLFR